MVKRPRRARVNRGRTSTTSCCSRCEHCRHPTALHNRQECPRVQSRHHLRPPKRLPVAARAPQTMTAGHRRHQGTLGVQCRRASPCLSVLHRQGLRAGQQPLPVPAHRPSRVPHPAPQERGSAAVDQLPRLRLRLPTGRLRSAAGQRHLRPRRRCVEALARAPPEAVYPGAVPEPPPLHEHVGTLIECLPDGGDVDLQPLFFNLAMDVATELLFGRSVYSLRAGVDQAAENREFAESFNVAQEGLAKRFRLAPFHFFYNSASFHKACRIVHRFVERYIREQGLMENGQLLHGEKAVDSASWFIRQVAAESATETDLRDQLLNVLLAGRDTTACCLSWTFRLLVRHPQALERLRREVKSVMGDLSSPTREQIRRTPFLGCVVNESLRLYPPVPLNNREAVKTTILPTGGGPDGSSPILVRKGELVVFSQYVNSRRKNIFGADADEFQRERWETGELDKIGWAYFPFIGGPRQCLGEDFVLMEVSYTTVRLLQQYRTIELPEGEPNEPVGTERQKLTLVFSSADGCRVTVRRGRQSEAEG